MFKILLHNKAAKAYSKLDDKTTPGINKSIDALKGNPFYGKDIKRLRGKLEGKYRLRVGEYQIVYSHQHFFFFTKRKPVLKEKTTVSLVKLSFLKKGLY